MEALKRVARSFSKAINWSCGFAHFWAELGIFLMMIVVFYAVVMRYIFNDPPLWSDEIGPHLFIFCTWIGIGQVLKDDHHIHFELLLNRLSGKKKICLQIVISFVGLLFCLLMTWYGVRYVIFQYSSGIKSNTLLAIPYWIPYLSIPLGSILISMEYLIKISGYLALLFAEDEEERRKEIR